MFRRVCCKAWPCLFPPSRVTGWLGIAALALPPLVGFAAEDSAADPQYAALQKDAQEAFKKNVAPFVKEYCVECHGNRRSKGGLNLEVAIRKPGDAAFTAKWKQSFANVKAHDMPPEDGDQPPEHDRARFLESLDKIKYLSPKDPGPFVIRRLTKAEYANTLRDLLGIVPDLARQLPDEVPGEGYLNSLSPMQTEQYLAITNEVLKRIPSSTSKAATAPPLLQPLLGAPPPPGADERSAARDAAATLARVGFRRPPSDAEVDVLLKVFDLGRANKLDYPGALRLMLKALLVSPQFLFITPTTEADAGKTVVNLDDHHLASRLSYFLWATVPDAELSGLADSGRLHDPLVLKNQVLRMLADSRSRALFDGFGAQWLGLAALKEKTFDTAKFPQMNAELRAAMYDEARLFFGSMVRDNRSVAAFIDSDYTFLNKTLAELYGLEKEVSGSHMRQVKLKDPNRGGILTMPGILAATSFPNRTSAVNRGVWVLEQVLGEEVPPAPANVPALEKQDQKTVANLTLRQRTELHRTNAVCANCHNLLDPIGFGLENFDAIGRWRVKDDTGGPIDAAGELPGGKRFSTPKELKAIIAARKDDLARNFTERLLAYALCRQLEGYDSIVVDQIIKARSEDGYRIQSIIADVVTSYPFLNRRVK
jgi:mono/diheme cytochrome c family protein